MIHMLGFLADGVLNVHFACSTSEALADPLVCADVVCLYKAAVPMWPLRAAATRARLLFGKSCCLPRWCPIGVGNLVVLEQLLISTIAAVGQHHLATHLTIPHLSPQVDVHLLRFQEVLVEQVDALAHSLTMGRFPSCANSPWIAWSAPLKTSAVTVQAYGDLKHFETPFVTKLHRHTPLSAPQEVFTFSHPAEQPADNTRTCRLHFSIDHQRPSAVCHGLAGYFDAKLYGTVHISTHPDTATPNMFSWFPIFFPLRHPVRVSSGDRLHVDMWRCVSSRKVWYEWVVTQPASTHLHNAAGRSYHVGM